MGNIFSPSTIQECKTNYSERLIEESECPSQQPSSNAASNAAPTGQTCENPGIYCVGSTAGWDTTHATCQDYMISNVNNHTGNILTRGDDGHYPKWEGGPGNIGLDDPGVVRWIINGAMVHPTHHAQLAVKDSSGNACPSKKITCKGIYKGTNHTDLLEPGDRCDYAYESYDNSASLRWCAWVDGNGFDRPDPNTWGGRGCYIGVTDK
jgi:hypothetical protein